MYFTVHASIEVRVIISKSLYDEFVTPNQQLQYNDGIRVIVRTKTFVSDSVFVCEC